MDKNLLVVMGEGAETLDEVRFILGFFAAPEHLSLTFFHTVTNPGRLLPGDTGASVRDLSCGVGPKDREADRGLERARRLLCGHGFEGSGMRVKTLFKRYASVRDVIMESEQGLYDAVAMGPPGVDWLEQAFGDGVGREVLEDYAGAPLWICREVEEERSGVLLCMDGSASSLAMADHVGFMLEHEARHRVTLYTVAPEGEDGEAQGREALGAGMAALLDNGLPEERIDARLVRGADVPGAILREAREGRHAAVAMGRTGTGQGRFPRLFMGSASDTVRRELSGAALWLSR
ncbi:universal stress protein [Desulfocurvus sp. DL9XJH121]